MTEMTVWAFLTVAAFFMLGAMGGFEAGYARAKAGMGISEPRRFVRLAWYVLIALSIGVWVGGWS